MSAIYTPTTENNEIDVTPQPMMTEKTSVILVKLIFCLSMTISIITMIALVFFNEDNASKYLAITIGVLMTIYFLGRIIVKFGSFIGGYILRSCNFIGKIINSRNFEIRLFVFVVSIIILGSTTNLYSDLKDVRFVDTFALVILYLLVIIIIISDVRACLMEVYRVEHSEMAIRNTVMTEPIEV
jgi:membrane protein YdbS with pleckstrin-like domain